MKLSNYQLSNFINRIKLQTADMPKYRTQVEYLKRRLEEKIENDDRTGITVTKYLLAGSWKKRTILRSTGDHPIDIDLILYVEGNSSLKDDMEKLHDFIVEYLSKIYPSKDIIRDVSAEGKTKSIKIKFSGSGLELDIVPVIPIDSPKEYVWQPERGGGGKYTTSVTFQLAAAKGSRDSNPSYTSIVRALKWWKNYKELKPELSSFMIELIVTHLDIQFGVENRIEEGLIRFFQFVSDTPFPIITFRQAINNVPAFVTPIFIGDPSNNENNTARKVNTFSWANIKGEAEEAFEAINIAQSKGTLTETMAEWKSIFGPNFSIEALS
jgi:hypothetical protein